MAERSYEPPAGPIAFNGDALTLFQLVIGANGDLTTVRSLQHAHCDPSAAMGRITLARNESGRAAHLAPRPIKMTVLPSENWRTADVRCGGAP